jgi:hypothetical protein
MKEELHPFCYKHLSEMKPYLVYMKAETAWAYVCSGLDCLVHYSPDAGYFIAAKDGNRAEQAGMPGICCPNDGTPMYRAEIQPEQGRLWKCSQCDKSLRELNNLGQLPSLK